MRHLIVILGLFSTLSNAQSFTYSTHKKQSFQLRKGQYNDFQYVMLDRSDITLNTLFDIDNATQQLIIPYDGYYEVEAFFNFNPDTASIKHNRGGINFGLVHIRDNKSQYMAASRFTFDKTNQDNYSPIEVLPTIVYLQQGDVVAPAISTGYVDTHLFYTHVGCSKTIDNCVSFSFNIRLISTENGSTDFF